VTDYYEIDFLDVESSKSGDAITLRYKKDGITRIHVVDGGFQATGESVRDHINKHYDSPTIINSVVATHPDGDHAGGLRTILQEFEVEELWMLRPWLYADELLPRFTRFKSKENLITRLKTIYPNIAALEEIAMEKGIQIKEPFQGENIDQFSVLAPTKTRYLDLVVESDKTPESAKAIEKSESLEKAVLGVLEKAYQGAVTFIKSLWGDENFSEDDTSAENEMSVVQYAYLNGHKILLTGDAGRDAMTESYDFSVDQLGVTLPGIDKFQVPHHGSRRNLSSELCDKWLGEQLDERIDDDDKKFSALISAAKKDEHHPRNVVVRAMFHRGGVVFTTENAGFRTSGGDAPVRDGWVAIKPKEYPDEMEGD